MVSSPPLKFADVACREVQLQQGHKATGREVVRCCGCGPAIGVHLCCRPGAWHLEAQAAPGCHGPSVCGLLQSLVPNEQACMTSQRSDNLTACGLMCWGISADSQSSRSNVLYRVLAAGCGWQTQSSLRCRWHCSRHGLACAAATQGALPAMKPCVYMWPCMQAPTPGPPMCECRECQISTRQDWC